MSDKKSIRVNVNLIKSILCGFALGIITLFIIENQGDFRYFTESSSVTRNGKIDLTPTVSNTAKVYRLTLTTPFKTRLDFLTNDLIVNDFRYGGKFHTYSFKLIYYLKATFKDFMYAIYIGIVYTFILFVIMNYKFSIYKKM